MPATTMDTEDLTVEAPAVGAATVAVAGAATAAGAGMAAVVVEDAAAVRRGASAQGRVDVTTRSSEIRMENARSQTAPTEKLAALSVGDSQRKRPIETTNGNDTFPKHSKDL